MPRTTEDGLFGSFNKIDSPFKNFVYTSHNANNGIKLSKQFAVIKISQIPGNLETLELGGAIFTFVSSGATGMQVNIGATIAETITNLIPIINNYKDSSRCTAYKIEPTDSFLLIETVAGYTPVFRAESTITKEAGWTYDVPQALLDSTSYFLRDNVNDADVKPVSLSERNTGTDKNFLY